MPTISKLFKRVTPAIDVINDVVAGIEAGTIPVSDADLRALAFGFVGQNFDPAMATTTQALTAGTIYASSIYVPPAITVTNVVFRVLTAAAGAIPTGLFVGLVDANGNLAAQSNNLNSSAIWTAVGYAQAPLSAPITISDYEGGLYNAVVLQVGAFGTTQPGLARTNDTPSGTPSGVLPYSTAGTGQTALPAAGSLVTLSSAGSPHNFWVGLS